MNQHNGCPACESEGEKVHGQDVYTLVCVNEACRVHTFATYYG